jgi:amino acid transporter
MGGTNGLVGGILIAVYMFSGWDTSVYVNEETRDSRMNLGRAVLISVGTLTVMYALSAAWVAVKSVPGLGGWWSPVLKLAYLMIGIGVLPMIVARARHPTDYFSRPVEAYQPGQPG